jgi:hypothetical protein
MTPAPGPVSGLAIVGHPLPEPKSAHRAGRHTHHAECVEWLPGRIGHWTNRYRVPKRMAADSASFATPHDAALHHSIGCAT